MTHPIHHYHKRKRIHSNKEIYPHPNRLKRVVDRLVYVVGIVAPMAAIPQVLKIWLEQDGSSISPHTFGTHIITNIVWLFYGFLHREVPIILLYSLWLIMNILIFTGALLYS